MSDMASSLTATVRLGSDVLLGSRRLHGSRVGVVCNHASVDVGFRHIIDRLAKAPGVHLAAIFGPQHGFRSDVQDNMVETPHGDDATRRVPVYSLYSDTREPTAEMLRDLDVLVIDLQDIGARIYTYIYTMANCLRAAARHRIPVIVCDRPNPIGGVHVEGASLSRGFESFVGQFPIPMRHGMTIGELAGLFNDQFGIGASLEICADGALAPRTVRGRDRTALGDALTEHAHARRGGGVSGHGPLRRHVALGRTRHDSPVRTGRRPVDRRRCLRGRDECARAARRLLQAGRVRPDIPETWRRVLRRLPDSRPGSPRLPAGSDRCGTHRDVSPVRPGEVCVEASAVRIRTATSRRSTSWPDRMRFGARSR